MGSGTDNRKNSDAPIIRRPKIGIPIGGNVGTDKAGAAADLCLASFDAKIKESNLTVTGVKADLLKKTDYYAINIGGTEVGKLNSKYSEMVTKCRELGVKYRGEVIKKNNSVYARFTRII